MVGSSPVKNLWPYSRLCYMQKLLEYRESLNGYPIHEVWVALNSRFSLKCFLRGARPTCRNSQSKCNMICVMRVAAYKVVYKVHI